MNEIIEGEPPFICSECGCAVDEDDIMEVDDDIYCQSCYDDEFVTCDRCGTAVRTDDAESDDDHSYCQDCYYDYYTRCTDCNYIISRDDAEYPDDDSDDPYCYNCYSDHENEAAIHDYSFKPAPVFYGDGSRYFGVELEIDEGGKNRDKAEELLNVANYYEENIYIKVDSSLNDGLELVTHPATLEYHQNTMRWTELLNKAKELGYLSHKTDTAGLHIHVNRNTFGFNVNEQEENISRVLYFVEHHWDELLKFSRRTASQMKRWANRYGYKNNPKEVMDYAKSGCLGRYTCVNITNYDTIEFRMFRGTLKFTTLIAAIQMVDAICEAAILMPDERISGLSWTDFVKSLPIDKYHELIVYLKERQLYVNEPVACEEDD